MTKQVFVDESKARGYLLVASVVVPADLNACHALVRGLLLRGERGIHMKKERPDRRQTIVAAIAASGVTAVVYDAGRAGNEKARRRSCLSALVAAHAAGSAHLVIDRDDSLVQWDRQQLIELSRAARCRDLLTYEHGKVDETAPLLALPDVVAWCWARGGVWRERIRPVVAEVRNVAP